LRKKEKKGISENGSSEITDSFKELDEMRKTTWQPTDETIDVLINGLKSDEEHPRLRERLLSTLRQATQIRQNENEARETLRKFEHCGAYLRSLRETAGFTLEEAARSARISKSTLQDIEEGKTSILDLKPSSVSTLLRTISSSYRVFLNMVRLTMMKKLREQFRQMMSEALPRLDSDISEGERRQELIAVTLEALEPKKKNYVNFLEKLEADLNDR
jgi:transcriptional regulator with XRE-family HTH domain